MTTISSAHNALSNFCKGQPGIAIGAEIFTSLVIKAINLANTMTTIPTQSDFHNKYSIGFTSIIDASNMSINLEKDSPPSPAIPKPVITLNNIQILIIISLDKTPMSAHLIEYSEIIGSISFKGERLSLDCQKAIGKWTREDLFWNKMATLPDGDAFDSTVQDEWRIQEKAIKLVAKNSLGSALLQAVELPNIIQMFSAVKFVGPITIGGESGLIMFTGPAEWNFGCPRTIAKTLAYSYSTNVNLNNGKPQTRIQIDSAYTNDPNHSYPTNPEQPELKIADVFVHLPKVFVELRFQDITKPAAGFFDDGYYNAIYWHYEASIISKGKLTISMTNLWPLEFKLDVPSRAVGLAGAGIKEGCIYIEAGGFAFRGEIDPLEFYFRLGQDTFSSELYFESKFGIIDPHDFEFTHWPIEEFPISAVTNFILGRAAEYIVKEKSGELLNVTRFSLVEYGLLKNFGQMLPGMAAEKSNDTVTVGVSFQKNKFTLVESKILTTQNIIEV